MDNILIFAGTTEGRQLTEAILRWDPEGRKVFVSVATEYGKRLLPEGNPRLQVLASRMEPEEMRDWISRHRPEAVIDATHPYAAFVSANIREAAGIEKIPYIRLLREESKADGTFHTFSDMKAAVQYLNNTAGKILLTTGSKELSAFTQVEDFQKRIYARILPVPEAVEKAFALGFDAGHLICMQGPFSHEINAAMLRQTGADYLVTKESGKAGGFEEKLSAAEETGAKAVIIGRPVQEKGCSLKEVLEQLGIAVPEEQEADREWFPLFLPMRGRKVLIAGAGKIAARRAQILSRFAADLTVIALELSEPVLALEQAGSIRAEQRAFDPEDLKGMELVLAATDDAQTNRNIVRLCKERGIPVNAADRKEECDFYFPAVVQSGKLTAGLTTGGADPGLTARGRKTVGQALEGLEKSSRRKG